MISTSPKSLVVVALMAIAFILGLKCGSAPQYADDDAIDAYADTAATYLAQADTAKLRADVTERTFRDTVRATTQLLPRYQRARARSDSVVGSISTPADGVTVVQPHDSVAFVTLQRDNDPATYRVPKFLVDGFLVLQAERDTAHQVIEAQRGVIDAASAMLYHKNRELAFKDSALVAQGRQIAALTQKANPRCGRKCTVALTLGGVVIGRRLAKEAGLLQ